MKYNSHLTAITRKTLPRPTRWLLKYEFFIVGKILDYGCGKCHSVNNKHFKCDGYDPYYRPNGIPKDKKYDTIICNYVLCTLPQHEWMEVLRKIQGLLTFYGFALISVRNDKPKQGWGVSKRGTYQGRVRGLPLKLMYKCSQFRTYLLTRADELV